MDSASCSETGARCEFADTDWRSEAAVGACSTTKRERRDPSTDCVVKTKWARRAYFFLKSFFKLARPLTAISFRVGSIRRQIAAARAITFTSVVNDSITTSPL
jgi:hypothetical protein